MDQSAFLTELFNIYPLNFIHTYLYRILPSVGIHLIDRNGKHPLWTCQF